MDWSRILLPTGAVLEVMLRGTLVYLTLFTLLRFLLKREAGGLAMTDLLVLVLIADAVQNAMAGSYTSVGDGLALGATIIFWAYLLDWLGFRFPRFQRLLHPPALPLVREGRMLRQNMRRELVTEDELLSQLRQQGIEDLSQVKIAYIEEDGHISAIPRERPRRIHPPRHRETVP